MKKIALGVRFVERMSNGNFISRSDRVYFYAYDIDIAQNMVGHVCSQLEYRNFIVPVEYREDIEGCKNITSARVHIECDIESATWNKGALSYTIPKLAKELATIFPVQETALEKEYTNTWMPQEDNDDEAIYKNNLNKENINMNIPTMPNMNFGPYNNAKVSISFYGLAVQNTNTKRWFSYKGGESYDVTDFIMNGMSNMIFAVPVSIKKIAVGDIVLHNNVPMAVQTIAEGNTITAVDVSSSEVKTIIPAKNPLGFNFYTKLISMFGEGMFGDTDKDDGDNIFGGNPMMMAMMFGGFGNNDSADNNMGNMMQMFFMSKAMKEFM